MVATILVNLTPQAGQGLAQPLAPEQPDVTLICSSVMSGSSQFKAFAAGRDKSD